MLRRRTEQPFLAELAVVQLHKMHHAFQNRGPERIRFALPCCHDQPHRFTVERFAHLLVEPESRTNAADAVISQLLAVIIETQPHPVGGCEKRLGNGIAAHHLGTELDACRQRRREAVLLGKEQGFLLTVMPVYTLQRIGRSLPPLRRMRPSMVCCPSVTMN